MDKDDKRFQHHHLGNNFSWSRSVHYKQNKARGWRRKADRHTHHRRRQIMKTAIKNGIEDYILPPSSGNKSRGCGFGPPLVAQNKITDGPRDQFYLKTPKKKSAPQINSWPPPKIVRPEIPVTTYWNTVYNVLPAYDPKGHRNYVPPKDPASYVQQERTYLSGRLVPKFDEIVH